MAKEYAKAFYKSKAWKQCRESYIQMVDGLCETCLEHNRITPGKIVHHKKYITPDNINNPEITLNHDNLIYECQDCHNNEHHSSKQSSVMDGLMFTDTGDIVQVFACDSPPIKKSYF